MFMTLNSLNENIKNFLNMQTGYSDQIIFDAVHIIFQFSDIYSNLISHWILGIAWLIQWISSEYTTCNV